MHQNGVVVAKSLFVKRGEGGQHYLAHRPKGGEADNRKANGAAVHQRSYIVFKGSAGEIARPREFCGYPCGQLLGQAVHHHHLDKAIDDQ